MQPVGSCSGGWSQGPLRGERGILASGPPGDQSCQNQALLSWNTVQFSLPLSSQPWAASQSASLLTDEQDFVPVDTHVPQVPGGLRAPTSPCHPGGLCPPRPGRRRMDRTRAWGPLHPDATGPLSRPSHGQNKATWGLTLNGTGPHPRGHHPRPARRPKQRALMGSCSLRGPGLPGIPWPYRCELL